MARVFYSGLGKTKNWTELSDPTSLTYDDVLITPRNSTVESRTHVDTTVQFGPYTLTLPIISAPMDTITGDAMVRKLADLGGIGCLPRDDKQRFELCALYREEGVPCVFAVGQKNGFEDAKKLKERGAKVILVDAANGGTTAMKELASDIKSKLDLTVMAGNITTYEQAEDYKKYDIDMARVGVGGGGLCTTRLKTGVGMPQLSALFETTEAGAYVIADGGIRQPGDVAKALAAGAKMVMIGSLFAGTNEAPGEIIEIAGEQRKYVRGQASKEYMDHHNIQTNAHKTAEGIGTTVALVGPVADIIMDISGGLRSAMTYVGARNLQEFEERAWFTKISGATMQENKPHIVFDRK